MRLHIGELGAEQLADALNRQILSDINALTAAVVTLARITLGILVGEHGAHCRHNGRGNDVLRRNQLNVAALAVIFLANSRAQFGIQAGDKCNIFFNSLRF